MITDVSVRRVTESDGGIELECVDIGVLCVSQSVLTPYLLIYRLCRTGVTTLKTEQHKEYNQSESDPQTNVNRKLIQRHDCCKCKT